MEKIELNSVNAQNIDTFYMTVDGYAILGILIELTLRNGHRELGGLLVGLMNSSIYNKM